MGANSIARQLTFVLSLEQVFFYLKTEQFWLETTKTMTHFDLKTKIFTHFDLKTKI